MRVEIFRAEMSGSYPQDYEGFRYDFKPIEHKQEKRDNLLLGSTYESGDEPFAVVIAPDGCEVSESKSGERMLYVSGNPVGLRAYDVLDMAKRNQNGLSLE